jgi:GT2 family glycosyltransferase
MCGSVTVIVVNWKRAELLARALASLANQTIASEIIVVDNESSGDTRSLARLFPDVRWIRNRRNEGFCRANNQGIDAAHGEFIALLNNDAEAEPGWLEALRACFRRKDIGMAASKILVYDDPGVIDKAGHLIYPDGQNRGRGSGQRDCGQFDREEETLWPDGCAAMYRKSMLDRIGGFDENLFAYGDDAELGLRARIAGWSCMYTPRAVVHHRRAMTLGKSSWRRIALIERNRVLLAARHFPFSLLWRNLYYYALRIAGGIRAAARNEGEVALHRGIGGKTRLVLGLFAGDLSALWNLPRTFYKRTCRASRGYGIRKLKPREIHNLILKNGTSVHEISTRAVVR